MPKRITYLQARSDKSTEDFRAHWSTTHADIARDLPGVQNYRQNHVLQVVDSQLRADAYRVDGIVELWFADNDVVQAGFASEVADKLIVDEQIFLSGLTGGPVHAASAPAPWAYKLWALARWNLASLPSRNAVERWAQGLFHACEDAIGWDVNVLHPGAELLTRDALDREKDIPEVAVAIGFADESAARTAMNVLALGSAPDTLSRVHLYLAEEIVII